jgi:hypothetical protein
MKKRKQICSSEDCYEEPFLGGLCKEHYEQEREERALRRAAMEALQTGTINGRRAERPELSEELEKIRKWWFRACSTVNYRLPDSVLGDEAKYAVDWCIDLAEQIVATELAFRRGADTSASVQYEFAKEWVWSRFRNLEAGLMSNGVKRPEERTS